MIYSYIIIALLLLFSTYFSYVGYYLSMVPSKRTTRLFEKFLSSKNTHQDYVNLPLLSRDTVKLLKYLFFLLSEILFCFLCANDVTCSISLFQGLLYILIVFIVLDFFSFLLSRYSVLSQRRVLFFFIRKGLTKLFSFVTFILPKNLREMKITNQRTIDLFDTTNESNEETMLKGILQFGNETVKDIMTARPYVLDLDVKTPFAEVLRIISENSYSRIPVYSGTKDNIIGILYIKDVLPYINKGEKFRWSSLIRPQLSVPETKRIDNLLREFQMRKIHIAVVIDEYGGVSGIVTMEDIIEEIVGEINDEHDDDNYPFVSLGVNNYIFDAKTSLQSFSKIFNLEPDFFDDINGDVDTLAGLLLDIIGDFPKKHQIVDYHHFRFEILDMDERHISKVKVTSSAT